MQKADFYLSLVLMAFGLLMAVWIIPGQSVPSEQYGMSPAALPMICAVGITVLSVFMFVKNLPRKWTQEGSMPVIGRHALIRTGLNIALALVALFFMNTLGFYPGGVFLIASGMLAAGRRSPLWIGVISLLVPAVVMLILDQGLSIALP